MQIRVLSVWAIAVGILGGCAARSGVSTPRIVLRDLPSLQRASYRADPYITAADRLQSLGRRVAFRELLALSQSDDLEDGQRIVVLCRMLFTKRHGSEFRRAMIGCAAFPGDTVYTDWTLEPIELVDGIPFAVTYGYVLAGNPESPESYVRYCISNCDWRPFQFSRKSEAEKRDALSKLLASPKWRRPLEPREREFFAAQIK